MSTEIRKHEESAATAFGFTGVRFLTSVAVHVRSKGARTGKAFITDLTLVLLLRELILNHLEISHR